MPDGDGYWHVVDLPTRGWQLRAACQGVGTKHFYRDDRGPYGNLGWTDFCQRCPVRVDCLAHAIGGEERWGVWGGYTPNARRSLLSQLLEGTVTWEQIERALT